MRAPSGASGSYSMAVKAPSLAVLPPSIVPPGTPRCAPLHTTILPAGVGWGVVSGRGRAAVSSSDAVPRARAPPSLPPPRRPRTVGQHDGVHEHARPRHLLVGLRVGVAPVLGPVPTESLLNRRHLHAEDVARRGLVAHALAVDWGGQGRAGSGQRREAGRRGRRGRGGARARRVARVRDGRWQVAAALGQGLGGGSNRAVGQVASRVACWWGPGPRGSASQGLGSVRGRSLQGGVATWARRQTAKGRAAGGRALSSLCHKLSPCPLRGALAPLAPRAAAPHIVPLPPPQRPPPKGHSRPLPCVPPPNMANSKA
jgi:hypothetical protein